LVAAPGLLYDRVVRGRGFSVALTVVLLASCASDRPAHPNVLLISIDSLRADHVGVNGYARPTTPHLDELAAQGAAFLTAHAPAPWTLPSHVTLLTSLPPAAHRVVRRNRALTSQATTLAEVLQAEGYATAAFVSAGLLRRAYGYDQGFDVYDQSAWTMRLGRGRRTPKRNPQNRGTADRRATSPVVVRLVDDWITRTGAADRTRPFFAFVHLWDVHYDYDPPPPYDTMFDPDYAGHLDASHFETNPALHRGMDPRDLAHLVALYDGEIRFTDEWIGRLLDRLAALGLAEDTIVVVTADHGDEFLEHGRLGHIKTLFEELLRIPLIVRYPRRVPPGQRFAEPVRLEDVAPTILGLAGVASPPDFGLETGPPGARGVDLSPWLVGSAPEPFPELPVYASSAVFGPKRSVQVGGKKLIVHGKPPRTLSMFYDLATNPAEQGKGDTARLARAERRRLARLLDRWTAFFDDGDIDYSRRWAPPRDFLQQLRALGYVE
jgi:arylsulfatase A-like enzyme